MSNEKETLLNSSNHGETFTLAEVQTICKSITMSEKEKAHFGGCLWLSLLEHQWKMGEKAKQWIMSFAHQLAPIDSDIKQFLFTFFHNAYEIGKESSRTSE